MTLFTSLFKATEPTFLFLIGAMKSGTTSLSKMLARHPHILRGDHKEPSFFASRGQKHESFAAYRAQWRPRLFARPRYLLDASTSYSKFPAFGDAAAQIAGAVENAKYIYLMRDPVARIESQIAHAVSADADAFARFEAEGETMVYYKHALDVSSYAAQLERYAAAFDAGDMMLIRFEDMLARPDDTLARLWSFLDLKPIRSPNRLPRQNPRRDDLEKVADVRLPGPARAMLHKALADDMTRLRDRFGVDTTDWGF